MQWIGQAVVSELGKQLGVEGDEVRSEILCQSSSLPDMQVSFQDESLGFDGFKTRS